MHGSRFAAPLAMALAATGGAGQAKDEVERGRALLAQYQCGSCHRIPGVAAARGTVGPPLEAWARRSYIAGRLPNRPELLQRWIVSPPSLVPGTAMPSMGVAPHDARAIAAYLYSLE
jgi:cytochrome c2